LPPDESLPKPAAPLVPCAHEERVADHAVDAIAVLVDVRGADRRIDARAERIAEVDVRRIRVGVPGETTALASVVRVRVGIHPIVVDAADGLGDALVDAARGRHERRVAVRDRVVRLGRPQEVAVVAARAAVLRRSVATRAVLEVLVHERVAVVVRVVADLGEQAVGRARAERVRVADERARLDARAHAGVHGARTLQACRLRGAITRAARRHAL
jgi:hypothetical protein